MTNQLIEAFLVVVALVAVIHLGTAFIRRGDPAEVRQIFAEGLSRRVGYRLFERED